MGLPLEVQLKRLGFNLLLLAGLLQLPSRLSKDLKSRTPPNVEGLAIADLQLLHPNDRGGQTQLITELGFRLLELERQASANDRAIGQAKGSTGRKHQDEN